RAERHRCDREHQCPWVAVVFEQCRLNRTRPLVYFGVELLTAATAGAKYIHDRRHLQAELAFLRMQPAHQSLDFDLHVCIASEWKAGKDLLLKALADRSPPFDHLVTQLALAHLRRRSERRQE